MLQSCPTQEVRKPEYLSISSHEALSEHWSQGVISLEFSSLRYTCDENSLVTRESRLRPVGAGHRKPLDQGTLEG